MYTPRIIFSIKHPRFNFPFIFHILPRLTYQLPHIVCQVSGEWLFVGSSISFVCSISLNLFSFSSSFSLFPQYSIHSIFLKIFLFPHLQFLLWEFGNRDSGLGTWDLGLGTWDLGLGTWDLGLGTWGLGLGLGYYIWLINIWLSGFSFLFSSLHFLLKIFLSLFSSFSFVHLPILFGHLVILHGHGH